MVKIDDIALPPDGKLLKQAKKHKRKMKYFGLLVKIWRKVLIKRLSLLRK